MKKRLDIVRHEQGMTLIEIMVVLVIIGLVMGVLVPKVLGAGDKAKRRLTETQMVTLKADISQFRLQYNSLPTTLQDLVKCNEVTGPGCVPIGTEETLKDAWGNPFVYKLENGNRSYRLMTYGSDGKQGGEGVDFDYFIQGP